MVAFRTCTINGCDRKHHGRGLCDAHVKLEMRNQLPEYSVWQDIKRRCYNPNFRQFNDYGGRGIRVDERWRTSFSNFLEDMGKRPSNKHSIDRIDVDGDYSPDNCRWATLSEQANNKRNNVILVHDGLELTFTGWSKKLGVSRNLIADRFYKGWNVTDILTIPKGGKRL